MVQLVEVTDEEDVYFNFSTSDYIRCPRTIVFPHKPHESWPAQTPEQVKNCKRLNPPKLREGVLVREFIF